MGRGCTAKGDKSSKEGVYKLPREWFSARERNVINLAFISWYPEIIQFGWLLQLFGPDPRSIVLSY